MRSSRLFTLLALSFTLSLLLSTSTPTSLVAAQDASTGSGSGSSSGSSSSGSSSGKTVSELLKEGTISMSTGRFQSAIQSFDEAILLDPTAYLSYYRRATAALSLGRTSAALADLDQLLVLKPEFAQAHFDRANVLTKEGELQRASEAIEAFLKLKGGKDEKGVQLKRKIQSGLAALQRLKSSWEAVDEKGVKMGKDVKADQGLKSKAEECLASATAVLEVSPNHLEARSRRGECKLALGELDDAIGDWSGIVHLSPSIDLLLRLSSLKYYILGDSPSAREAGLSHLKACLTSDPDNKICAKAHRKMRTVEKALKKAEKFAEGGTWRPVLSALKGAKVGGPTVIDEVTAAIKSDMQPTRHEGEEEGAAPKEALIPPSIKDAVERSGLLHYLQKLHCRAHTELNEYKKAKPYCEAVLAREPEEPWALVHKGDEALKEEKYEEAVRHFRTASDKVGGQDQGILTKLQKAQRLLKQSTSKDYYKVLGVPRDVDGPTLKKAYRKLAKENHPDKGGSAEKMAQINEAFDVLGDAEKRAQFDSGVDPNDPMAGAGGQGNPFVFQQGGGGGNPFQHFFQQGGAGGGGGGGGGQHFFKQQFAHSGGAGRAAGGGGGGGHFPFDF